ASTRTFTGSVPNTAAGLSIVVTAKDTSGLSTSETFAVSTPASAPTLTSQTAAQTWKLGQAVNFTLAANTFTDPQAQALTYSAKLSNGSALPSWLTFNASTRAFTGTVPNTAAGLSIVVTAKDTSGLSTSETFAVSTPASAPTLTSQTSAQTVTGGRAFTLALSASTFTDPQHEALHYKATQANGAALPSWLSFNASTDTFSGTAPSATQSLALKVTATDTSGLSATESFSLSIAAAAAHLSQVIASVGPAGTSSTFSLAYTTTNGSPTLASPLH
ncbi:MAG: putative Ig domain-containing protein, partial [Ancalomicrobiaceae bacterium]|nr:putative Ig domain-containing protein [Ancalomicrobiaceae bacterium]